MVDLQCHKGQPCLYSPVLCQEGYCSDCAIYIERFSSMENMEKLKVTHILITRDGDTEMVADIN